MRDSRGFASARVRGGVLAPKVLRETGSLGAGQTSGIDAVDRQERHVVLNEQAKRVGRRIGAAKEQAVGTP